MCYNCFGDNMKLNNLIETDLDIEVTGIKMNSSEIEKGNLFVCTDYGTTDRHNYIDDAIKRGCSCVLAAHSVGLKSVPIIIGKPNDQIASICSKFYEEPQKKMVMIGVTGTDGKTSTSTIIQTLIGKDKCGYIGTNGYSCSKFNKDTLNTTPDSVKLFGYLDEFIKAGCEYVSMEASSEALMKGRLNEIEYDCSILTNITSEHLNIHGNLENYVLSKCKLFEKTKKDGYCVLNKDDEHYKEVLKHCNGKVVTYGSTPNNDLYYYDIELNTTYTLFKFKYKDKEYQVNSPYPGLFNVYNLSAAILALLSMGYKFADIEENIKDIKVSGRLEMIDRGQDFYVMVDYAHTPNGITELLKYVKLLPTKRSIVVIGQAGERDPYKRKDVGEIVARNADHAIFCYEDPRSEDPKDIIDMMTTNIKDLHNYEVIIDRHDAIKQAIFMAEKDDIVMVLGKGNETYQKLKDKTIYFNDIEECINDLDLLMK